MKRKECWWFRNPANQLRLVVYPIILPGFMYPRWCRMSSSRVSVINLVNLWRPNFHDPKTDQVAKEGTFVEISWVRGNHTVCHIISFGQINPMSCHEKPWVLLLQGCDRSIITSNDMKQIFRGTFEIKSFVLLPLHPRGFVCVIAGVRSSKWCQLWGVCGSLG